MIAVFCVFRNYLHKRINLEKQIVLTNNKLEIFYNMWSFIHFYIRKYDLL